MKKIVLSLTGFVALLPLLGLDVIAAPVQEKENTVRFFDPIIDHQLLLLIIFAIMALFLLGFTLYKIKHESLEEHEDRSIRISGF